MNPKTLSTLASVFLISAAQAKATPECTLSTYSLTSEGTQGERISHENMGLVQQGTGYVLKEAYPNLPWRAEIQGKRIRIEYWPSDEKLATANGLKTVSLEIPNQIDREEHVLKCNSRSAETNAPNKFQRDLNRFKNELRLLEPGLQGEHKINVDDLKRPLEQLQNHGEVIIKR